MINDCLQKFKESVSTAIIWSKETNNVRITFQNNSEDTFYMIQGEVLFFNKFKRVVGAIPVVYKYLKPEQVLSDPFKDTTLEIPNSSTTAAFRIASVDCDDPFICTSVEEKSIEVTDHNGDKRLDIKRIFDTDLFIFPEIE